MKTLKPFLILVAGVVLSAVLMAQPGPMAVMILDGESAGTLPQMAARHARSQEAARRDRAVQGGCGHGASGHRRFQRVSSPISASTRSWCSTMTLRTSAGPLT